VVTQADGFIVGVVRVIFAMFGNRWVVPDAGEHRVEQ
jgi:hypothetical protein